MIHSSLVGNEERTQVSVIAESIGIDMKKTVMILMILLIAGMVMAEVMDKIVAKVGSDAILMSDVAKQTQRLQSTGVIKGEVNFRQVLDQMIESRLLIQKAKELGLTVDDNQIRTTAERYIREIKKKFPNEQAFQTELRAMRMTQNDLLRFYIEQLTENALTERIIQSQIMSKVRISETELINFYETTKDSLAVKPISYNISMIMREVKASDDTDKQKLAEITAIADRLKKGEDFATLAQENSDCPSRDRGGDLGFFKKGMMVKEFEEAALKLSVGEVSPVVKTQFGYHLILLTDKKGDELKASHILKLVENSDEDKDREMELMELLWQRVIDGESFAVLARQYSTDEESASEGGEIGEFGVDDLPELFASVLEKTPLGEPTPVLENEGIYYIFIKTSENEARIYSFEEVREQVRSYLMQAKQMQEYDSWVEKIKRESYVEITL